MLKESFVSYITQACYRSGASTLWYYYWTHFFLILVYFFIQDARRHIMFFLFCIIPKRFIKTKEACRKIYSLIEWLIWTGKYALGKGYLNTDQWSVTTAQEKKGKFKERFWIRAHLWERSVWPTFKRSIQSLVPTVLPAPTKNLFSFYILLAIYLGGGASLNFLLWRSFNCLNSKVFSSSPPPPYPTPSTWTWTRGTCPPPPDVGLIPQFWRRKFNL